MRVQFRRAVDGGVVMTIVTVFNVIVDDGELEVTVDVVAVVIRYESEPCQ